MSRDVDQQTIQAIATAQADAIARWRASKRAQRLAQHHKRMQPKPETPADLAPWLQAVERDPDPVERVEALEAVPA